MQEDGGGPGASLIKVDRRITSTSELISLCLSLYTLLAAARDDWKGMTAKWKTKKRREGPDLPGQEEGGRRRN
jgi:hypothetical protein